ncbi:MAG: hypothetical protein IJV00_03085 [Clostridia bacterium]|nr:hypothetical protein [Clostridia bacterium]
MNENVITEKEVAEATKILQKYRSAKSSIERRTVENEEWWKLRGEEVAATGWLFNAIANKHADAMDNIPSPTVLPREESDREAARELSEIVPAVLESTGFERVYSEVWYDKLRYGTGCYGVFWDQSASRGRGDVKICRIDLLNLFWEGGITDLQSSRNVFLTKLVPNDVIRERYPDVGELSSSPVFTGAKYRAEEIEETEDKSVVVDWYYKKRKNGRDILHLCKFCSGKVLFASENEEGYEDGIYRHGKYPFFMDKLYSIQGSPCGLGLIDLMKNTQSQIDKLSSAIVKNAELSTSVRYFIRTDGSVNEEEFADFKKPFVHVQGSRLGEDSIREIKTAPIDAVAFSVLTHKIDELKETAGNRDFTQGATNGGVTAASAIVALQEAGNKLSRDMISSGYAVFSDVVSLVIELIREFYTLPRAVRILGDGGEYRFVSYTSRGIAARRSEAMGHDFGEFEPEFDVKVSAEKKSPFARVTQNELAKEFYAMGFFDPSRRSEAAFCLSLMEFEGKDRIMSKLVSGGDAQSGGAKTPVSDSALSAQRRAATAGAL